MQKDKHKQEKKKCHNCHGTGSVPSPKSKMKTTRMAQCIYCKGKGTRTSYYGPDKY